MSTTRLAKFKDHWRDAWRRDYVLRYERLDFKGLRCLHDGELFFSRGITAIVGGNGVGKSTLAQAAVEVLGGAMGIGALRDSEHRLAGCSLVADLLANGEKHQVSLIVGSEGRIPGGAEVDRPHSWVDPSAVAFQCQTQVLGDLTFDEVLQSTGERRLNDSELASAAYVVGKEYRSCSVYEIRDYGPFEVWPYFEVTDVNDVSYGSEDMGRGELALLTALWSISTAPRDSILVIEEPETHASSKSQRALMDVLAWACAKRGISAVVTTHSPVILSSIPREHQRLLVSDGGRSVVIPNPQAASVSALVGGGVAYKTLVLVEDECAMHFGRSLLERLDLDLSRQCLLVPMGGYAPIIAALRSVPRVEGWAQIVGLFDGDLRSNIKEKYPWSYGFLPGLIAPDLALKNFVSAADPGQVASAVQVGRSCVLVALAATLGLDSHDWMQQFPVHVGKSYEYCVRALTDMWMESHAEDAKSFLHSFRQVLSS